MKKIALLAGISLAVGAALYGFAMGLEAYFERSEGPGD